jgi:hypothetical protein
MEQRIDALEKRLARFRGGKGPDDEQVSEGASVVAPAPPSPPLINHEISSKIAAFQTEIRRLEQVPNTNTVLKTCFFTILLTVDSPIIHDELKIIV